MLSATHLVTDTKAGWDLAAGALLGMTVAAGFGSFGATWPLQRGELARHPMCCV